MIKTKNIKCRLPKKDAEKLAKRIEELLPEYAKNFSDSDKDEWWTTRRELAVGPLKTFKDWLLSKKNWERTF